MYQRSRASSLFGQRRHPALAVGGLELVLARADHLVGLVKEQHCDSSRRFRHSPAISAASWRRLTLPVSLYGIPSTIASRSGSLK